MVTYEAMNMLFQFGIFSVTALTAVVAIIALVKKKKEVTACRSDQEIGDYFFLDNLKNYWSAALHAACSCIDRVFAALDHFYYTSIIREVAKKI